MSFRPAAFVCTLALVACDAPAPAGPEQQRENVFAYSVVMRPGETLALRNMVGAMTIEPAGDDTLRVMADLRWRGDSTMPSDVRFSADSIAGGRLICSLVGVGVCSEDNFDAKSDGSGFSIGRGGLRLGVGGKSQAEVHFRVRVPTGVQLDLIQVEGDVIAASTAPIKVRGVNGDLTVVTSVGPVNAKMLNGSVDARMTTLAGNDSVVVETVNGSAYAFIPESASATVDVEVVNGSAISDFAGVAGGSEGMRKTIRGTLGAGTTPLRVRAINGNAQLRRLDAAGRAYELATPGRSSP